MMKIKKILKVLGLGLVLFIGTLYAINLVPTKLDPQVEPFLRKEKVTFQDKKFIENNEFILLLKNKDPKSSEDLKIFAQMMTKNPYPDGIRFPNSAHLVNFKNWNHEYLDQLSSLPEKNKRLGYQSSLDFIEKGLKEADTLMHHLLFLNFLRETAKSYGTQNWKNSESLGLKKRIEGLIEQRTRFLQKALDGEFDYQIYYVSLLLEDQSWQSNDFGLFDYGRFNFLFKPFFDFNATLNDSFQNYQSFRSDITCLETWNCKITEENMEFHFWQHPKNPVGEALLAVLIPALIPRMNHIQTSWDTIRKSIESTAI